MPLNEQMMKAWGSVQNRIKRHKEGISPDAKKTLEQDTGMKYVTDSANLRAPSGKFWFVAGYSRVGGPDETG